MSNSPIDDSAVDIALCDREPIHIPGSIQPHGFLVGVRREDLSILQASSNIYLFSSGVPVEELIGKDIAALTGRNNREQLLTWITAENIESRICYLGTMTLAHSGSFDVLAHVSDGLLILEFEPTSRQSGADFRLLYPVVGKFISSISDADSVQTMSQLAVDQIKSLTGFGRVLLYRFDAHGHGHVLTEAKDEAYHSYLHQRFPASDVPRQARELYLANHIRLIADANYVPAPLVPAANPLTGGPTNLAFSALRSVSPVHVRYMKNMGTLASMSISLVVKGELWGLISCHHVEPRFVPFEVRAACEQLGQLLALRIEAREDIVEYNARLDLRRMVVDMLSALSQGADFIDNMTSISHELLRFGSASGAALVFEGRIMRYGDAPSKEQIRQLVEWLGTNLTGDIFQTDSLTRHYPQGERIKTKASGVLALPISQIHRHYLIWFRPEVIQTVEWAGNPTAAAKAADVENPGRLNPRNSFAVWRETVHATSLPWRNTEIETALEFRTAVLGIVLKRAEAMAELAEELGRANKELESFSYSVSHDLRAPLRHIVGFTDLLQEFDGKQLSERSNRFLKNIKDSARFAGKLVDDLLSFSQMGRAGLRVQSADMNELVKAAMDRVMQEAQGARVSWQISPFPVIQADPTFLQLALYNLLSNAVKYSRTRDTPVISMSHENSEIEDIFHIRDNGVGFSMEYAHKLFGVFQRLHRMEEFEGTGIGLANVKRIIERHGGRVWAEGVPDGGAVFSFSLPKQRPLTEEDGYA
ncbi:MAG TPA: ATP-binding protein [Noviherbaspirillum sp.]|uniref:ATP-binding protein n=1 Tax=Noviherbaspirillum sp. TaxID=1926288 RepID=UPI002DDDA4B3|nr:ATP-binding protein [Noviherbaspirillum sp.]HEV2610801.1 ATP-binding protein [Noviherbaspirillum sp.]